MQLSNLINIFLIKKLTKSGKKRSALTLINTFSVLIKDERLLYSALLTLLIPIKHNIKSKKTFAGTKYTFLHFSKALSIALNQLIKSALIRKRKKMSFSKALYLECHDVLKKRGLAYT